MVTIREIAIFAGVSRGTVDRAINHRPGVNPQTAEEIRKLAASLGYRPNVAGKLLAAQKKDLRLAFITFDAPEYSFFRDVYESAVKKAEELRPYSVSVQFYRIRAYGMDDFRKLFAQIEADRIDGIATTPMNFPLFAEFLQRQREKKVPVVFYNLDAFPESRLCYVGCDYVKAGRVAAGLTALSIGGAGKVGILTHCDSNNQSYEERMCGYISELQSRYPNITLLGGGKPTVFSQDDYAGVQALVRQHPELNALYIVNLGDYSVCEVAHKAAEGRKLNIITNDLVPAQRRMLHEGIISATLGQQPEVQGALPLQILYEYLMFGISPDQDKIPTELNIYIGQNA